MNRINVSEKEYFIMMLFINEVLRKSQVERLRLISFLMEKSPHLVDPYKIGNTLIDLEEHEVLSIPINIRVFLFEFVGVLLTNWERDRLFYEVCSQNDVSHLKLAYIAFNAFNIERIERN